MVEREKPRYSFFNPKVFAPAPNLRFWRLKRAEIVYHALTLEVSKKKVKIRMYLNPGTVPLNYMLILTSHRLKYSSKSSPMETVGESSFSLECLYFLLNTNQQSTMVFFSGWYLTVTIMGSKLFYVSTKPSESLKIILWVNKTSGESILWANKAIGKSNKLFFGSTKPA